jgi:membrane protein
VARAVITRFELGGDAAVAVERLFAQPSEGTVGGLSVVLLVFSGISLTRRLQRMYLLAWRLEPLPGVRGSLNAVLGLAALLVEIALLSLARSWVHGLPGDGAMAFLLSAVAGILLWTSVPWLLLDRRVTWRRLLLAGVLTSTSVSIYGSVTSLYMPRLMESYSERYGLFGITLALVGWLLVITMLVVTTTVVAAELDHDHDHDRAGSSHPHPSQLPRQG